MYYLNTYNVIGIFVIQSQDLKANNYSVSDSSSLVNHVAEPAVEHVVEHS